MTAMSRALARVQARRGRPRPTVSCPWAKAANATNFGSQFFVNLKDNPSLDFDNGRAAFYPWGKVESGFEVIDAMGAVETNPPLDGQPVEPITILDVVITETPSS